MMKFIALVLGLLVAAPAQSHEMTPAYFKLTPSYMEGVLQTKISIFNRRIDVDYYQIDVYDQNWKPVRFAAESKIIQVRYQKTKEVDIFVRSKDQKKITYICTTSKLRKEDIQNTAISSMICSKME